MEENMGSLCSNLTSTCLTCLALNLPWFHAPQIEAEPKRRSSRHISAPHPYPFASLPVDDDQTSDRQHLHFLV